MAYWTNHSQIGAGHRLEEWSQGRTWDLSQRPTVSRTIISARQDVLSMSDLIVVKVVPFLPWGKPLHLSDVGDYLWSVLFLPVPLLWLSKASYCRCHSFLLPRVKLVGKRSTNWVNCCHTGYSTKSEVPASTINCEDGFCCMRTRAEITLCFENAVCDSSIHLKEQEVVQRAANGGQCGTTNTFAGCISTLTGETT